MKYGTHAMQAIILVCMLALIAGCRGDTEQAGASGGPSAQAQGETAQSAPAGSGEQAAPEGVHSAQSEPGSASNAAGSSEPALPEGAGQATGATSTTGTGTATPPVTIKPPPQAGKQGSEPVTVTVGELVASRKYVGALVAVEGRCMGWATDLVPGGPPRTRSDWVLVGDDGAAIYVTGELPPGCSPTQGSKSHVTIVARVAKDILPGVEGGPPTPRSYLVRH